MVLVFLGSGGNAHLPLSLGLDEVIYLPSSLKCEWGHCDSCWAYLRTGAWLSMFFWHRYEGTCWHMAAKPRFLSHHLEDTQGIPRFTVDITQVRINVCIAKP